jgi:hypothetical protein
MKPVYAFVGIQEHYHSYTVLEIFNEFEDAKEAFEAFVGETWDVDEADMPLYDGASEIGPHILASCIVKTFIQ